MANELLKMLQERNRRRQPLPFATARQDETARAARVPYKTGSGGEFRDDLMKVAKEAYEWSPLSTIEDLYKAYKDPSLGNVGWAALGAIPGGKPAKKIGVLANKLLKAKRAAKAKKVYQGTPHTLEAEPGAPLGRLKDEAIGTGEGAAVYGRGHYVAEEPDVARNYRENLSTRDVKTGEKLDPELRIGGRPIYDEYKRLEDAAMKLPAKEAGKQYDKMSAVEDLMIDGDITSLRDRAKLGSYTDETVEYIEKELAPKFTRKGNVYEMALKTADEDFLMWDKPLSETKGPLLELAKKARKRIDSGKFNESDITVASAVEQSVKNPDFTGGRLYEYLVRSEGSPEAATQYLLRNNVRGIKYLDEGSRDVGKGTSNFVVLIPKILRSSAFLALLV